MKKYTVGGFACLFIAILFWAVVVWGKGDCQVPSGNDKFCYKPDSENVTSCDESPSGYDCSGDVYVYEIRGDFPEKAIEADAGHTKEVNRECWRRKGCVWDPHNHKCVERSVWSNWRQVPKIEVKNATACE